jgi:hypothetical protein
MLAITTWSSFAKQDKLVKVYSKLGGQLVGRISISKSLSMFDVLQDLCRQAFLLMPHESLSARNLAIWVGSLRLTPPGFEFKESFTKEEEQEVSDLIDKARRGKRVDMMWDDNYEHACQVLKAHDITWPDMEEDFRVTLGALNYEHACQVLKAHDITWPDMEEDFRVTLGALNQSIPTEILAFFRRWNPPYLTFDSTRQVKRDMTILESVQHVSFGLQWIMPTVWPLNLVFLSFNGMGCSFSFPPGIGQCSKLFEVYIRNVKVLPEDFCNLRLTRAHFRGCDAHDIAAKVCNMQSLEYLTIESSGNPTLIPTSLGRLSSLKRLHLCNNKFVGTIPTEFGLLKSLNTLVIEENSPGLDPNVPSEVLALNLERLGVECV